MRSWSARAVAVVGTSALAMTAFAGAAAAAEPTAAPAQSHAEAQFLSGGLFNGFIPFDYLLALRGASATNTGQSQTVVQRNDELVTLLGFPIISNPNGTPVDPASAIRGGFADQYAQAAPGGRSRAASGALSDSGVFGDNGSTAFPSDAIIDLSKMMGDGPFSGLQDATLTLSTLSSEAALTAGSVPATSCTDKTDPVNCLDYSAAGGTLSFTSPQLAKTPAAVTAALEPIDDSTATLESAITDVLKTFDTGDAGLNSLLAALGGGSNLSATVDLNVTQAVVDALKKDISAGGVTLNPTTGKVTIDIGSFVALNGQAPNTTLTNGQKLFDISPVIPTLTAAISQRITDAADTALASASVMVHADASLPGDPAAVDPTGPLDGLGVAAGGLGTPALPIDLDLTTGISIDLKASLASVANGSATATITAKVLGVPISVPVKPLTDALEAITAPVAATVNGAVEQLATAVSNGVGANLQDQIKPVTLSIPDFLTLKVNVQSNPTPGMYQVSALQVAINTPFGNLAIINLATSRVGANSTAGGATQTASALQQSAPLTVSAPSEAAGQVLATGAATDSSSAAPASVPTAENSATQTPSSEGWVVRLVRSVV